MLIAPARDNTEINSRSAIDPEGEGIIGCEATVLIDAGTYSGETGFPTSMISYTLGGVYELESVWPVSQVIYTKIPPTRFFRSRNGVYNSFALERTQEILRTVGMALTEFKKLNVVVTASQGHWPAQ